MKSLIVNASDSGGGAAIAAVSLHQALLKEGVDSHVAVQDLKSRGDQRIHQIPSGYWIDRAINAITFRLGLAGIDGTASYRLMQQEIFKSANVVNLHLIHGGYFNYLAVRSMAKAKPVVMTLHDMWHYTGHCVYSFDCDRWKTGCGRCPYPKVYVGVQRDATAFNVRTKKYAFVRPGVHLVAISSWMEDLLRQSYLHQLPIHRIPNGIDTLAYSPHDKLEAKAKLCLPKDRFLILCSAADLSDHRKGFDLLVGALHAMDAGVQKSTMLLLMGKASEDVLRALPVDFRHLGFVATAVEKSLIYSAADMFVLPTRADNLPVVLQEAMACGTPCVSFRVGGVPDLVRPGVTGFLAAPESASGLAEQMALLIQSCELRRKMEQMCRGVAVNEFSLERQGKAYLELFQSLVRHG